MGGGDQVSTEYFFRQKRAGWAQIKRLCAARKNAACASSL